MTLLHRHHLPLLLHVCCACVESGSRTLSELPACFCVRVCVRNCVPVEGSAGNGLISELAQAPHCYVVTTCHYHKHRLTHQAHTRSLAFAYTRAHTSNIYSIHQAHTLPVSPVSFSSLHFLSLSLSLVIVAHSGTGLLSSQTAVGS